MIKNIETIRKFLIFILDFHPFQLKKDRRCIKGRINQQTFFKLKDMKENNPHNKEFFV